MKTEAYDPEMRKRSGISLQRFAGAKKNRYDKKAILEKTAALNAKRANKYRKLKAKLEVGGQLKPFLPERPRVRNIPLKNSKQWCPRAESIRHAGYQ